ncbi:MAG: hypothetical protein AAB932_00345, partial [Patescibacteria group bacterium]
LVGDKIFEIECLENLESYIKVPEDIAIKYTFPYKWDMVGHPPMDIAMGAESTMKIFDYILGLLGKPLLDLDTKKKLLQIIHQKALYEKRSFTKKDIQAIVG